MNATLEAAFYNKIMTSRDSLAMKPLEESPWLPMYKEAASWIRSEPVIDLGCGTGRFAQCLFKNGHRDYTGIDFAPAVIAEATKYASGMFRVQDLRDWQPEDIRPEATIYTTLEVLEHLDDDLDLVRRVPGGHRLIFSVPSYGSTSHVRRFPSPKTVWDRYSALLMFQRWSLVPVSASKVIHLVDSVRRVDSWQ